MKGGAAWVRPVLEPLGDLCDDRLDVQENPGARHPPRAPRPGRPAPEQKDQGPGRGTSEARAKKGYAYGALGETDKAGGEYKKAAAIDGNPNACFGLAKLYL